MQHRPVGTQIESTLLDEQVDHSIYVSRFGEVITESSDAAGRGMLSLGVKHENAACAAERERGSEEHHIWTNDPDIYQRHIVTPGWRTT